MGRKRNPERDKSLQRYIESGGTMSLDELAMVVPKGVEEQQQEQETAIETGLTGDPEAGAAGGSSEKLKTAMKSIIKSECI